MPSPASAHFDKLADARFAQFGQACALTMSHLFGAPVVSVTAILVEGEGRSDFGAITGPLMQEGIALLIRASDIEAQMPSDGPEKGNTVTIDGRTFTVIEKPLRRDTRRLIWSLVLQEQSS